MDPVERERRRAQTQLFVDLLGVRNAADRRVERKLAELGVSGITAAQANTLMVLVNARRPMTAAELARALGVSEVTVGRFVHAMASAGWVERRRDRADTRRVWITPTAMTREALPAFVRVTNELLDDVFEGVDDERLLWLAQWLSKVRAVTEE